MGATEFDKPLDHDLDELNSKITTGTNVDFTLKTGVTFTVEESNCKIFGGLYCCDIKLMPTTNITTGEKPLATVSVAPSVALCGVVVKPSNSQIVGSFFVNSDKNVYINFTESIPNATALYASVCGCA